MDFINRLQALAQLIEKQNENIATVEETKNTLVLPFIKALGYDVADPTEVRPDFFVDVGGRTSGKVDYAVFIDDKPALLFECRSGKIDLQDAHPTQLRNCFHAASAGIGVLTNGKSYAFYTDFEEQNVMDAEPFWRLNLVEPDEQTIAELQMLSKSSFDPDQACIAANELKYLQVIKSMLLREYSSPSLEFIGFFSGRLSSGRKTPQVLDRFMPIVKAAFNQFVDDRVNDRLQPVKDSGAEGLVENIHTPISCFETDLNRDIFIIDEEFERFFVVDVT